MSTTYSIFIKGDKPTSVIKPALETILQCELGRVGLEEKDELYSTNLLGLNIALWGTWTYADDVIRFSEYSHEIMADYIFGSFDNYYRDDWERMTCIVVASMMAKATGCETIVVRDVQVVIETFEP